MFPGLAGLLGNGNVLPIFSRCSLGSSFPSAISFVSAPYSVQLHTFPFLRVLYLCLLFLLGVLCFYSPLPSHVPWAGVSPSQLIQVFWNTVPRAGHKALWFSSGDLQSVLNTLACWELLGISAAPGCTITAILRNMKARSRSTVLLHCHHQSSLSWTLCSP